MKLQEEAVMVVKTNVTGRCLGGDDDLGGAVMMVVVVVLFVLLLVVMVVVVVIMAVFPVTTVTTTRVVQLKRVSDFLQGRVALQRDKVYG